MYKIPIYSDYQNYLKLGNTKFVKGNITTSGNHAGGVEAVNVTFPSNARFTKTPLIFCTAIDEDPYIDTRSITVANKSVNGFTVYVYAMDARTRTINYFAIGGA